MLVSKYNSDRQPEMLIWPPKPEIITSRELWQIAFKFPRQIWDFRWCRAQQRISQIIATTTDCQKLRDCNFQLSVVAAIAGGQFRCTGSGRKRKPQICRWNCHPVCHSCRDISISGFGGNIAISGCRSLPQSPGVSYFALDVVENPRFAVEIAVISIIPWEIQVLPVLMATLLFPVIRQCHIYLWTLSLTLAWSKTLFTALELR